jgi:hypothetical protein
LAGKIFETAFFGLFLGTVGQNRRAGKTFENVCYWGLKVKASSKEILDYRAGTVGRNKDGGQKI